jgi:hypothetical protein
MPSKKTFLKRNKNYSILLLIVTKSVFKKEIESTTTSLERSILSSIKEATPIKEKEQKNAIEEKLEIGTPLEFQKTKTFFSRMVTIIEFNQSIEKKRKRKKSPYK